MPFKRAHLNLQRNSSKALQNFETWFKSFKVNIFFSAIEGER